MQSADRQQMRQPGIAVVRPRVAADAALPPQRQRLGHGAVHQWPALHAVQQAHAQSLAAGAERRAVATGDDVMVSRQVDAAAQRVGVAVQE